MRRTSDTVPLLLALMAAHALGPGCRRSKPPMPVVGVAAAFGSATFSAFAGGAFYFPVLPGPGALVYVAAVLLVAWGAGAAHRLAHDAHRLCVLRGTAAEQHLEEPWAASYGVRGPSPGTSTDGRATYRQG